MTTAAPAPAERVGGLHLTRSGDTGPAVLWLHGYSLDASLWDELWALLPGYRHIGVDLPGHGRSAPLRPGTALPDVAAVLDRICRDEGAARVVGLSFGTCLAIQLAADHPETVRRLVLGAPAILGGPEDPRAQRRYGELAMLRRALGPGEAMADLWLSSPPDIFKGTERHPALRARVRAVATRHRWRELADGSFRDLTRARQPAEVLRRIAAATLVCVGDEEMPAFRRNAETLRTTLDDCTVLELPETGHLALLERPKESAEALEAHLR